MTEWPFDIARWPLLALCQAHIAVPRSIESVDAMLT